MSTPWAYGLLDRQYEDFSEHSTYVPRNVEPLCAALEKQDLSGIAERMYNIFETGVLPERPVAEKIRKTLMGQGALGAMMSGSGPSVFGIFPDEKVARKAANALGEEGIFACVCRPIEKR